MTVKSPSLALRMSSIELLAALMANNKLLVKRVFDDLPLREFVLVNLELTTQESIV